MSVVTLTDSNFQSEIGNGAMIVDFWADWCMPCKMFSPTFHEAAEEIKDIRFGTLNVDEAPTVAQQYQIMNIPTVAIFRDGEMVAKNIGVLNKELLRRFIQENM